MSAAGSLFSTSSRKGPPMQKALLVTGLVASTVLIGVPAKSAPVTFTDGTFNLANYAQSLEIITGAGPR